MLIMLNFDIYLVFLKQEMSNGSILLSKILNISIVPNKKKCIFQIETNLEDNRIYFIKAESEEVLKSWVEVITLLWNLHGLKYEYIVLLIYSNFQKR